MRSMVVAEAHTPREKILQVPAQGQVYDGHSIAFTGYADDPTQSGGGVFTFRNSFGPQWGNKGYGVMSFAYVVAYANDALWLQLEPPNAEVPLVRFEAESLPVLSRERCETSSQDMSEWGRTRRSLSRWRAHDEKSPWLRIQRHHQYYGYAADFRSLFRGFARWDWDAAGFEKARNKSRISSSQQAFRAATGGIGPVATTVR
jgi:hypothetical protein